ncbi:hypothetical protein I3843_01G292300 [Carya illinoinensis]|nr:hypothetical protein I3843_01G292300 [Carya illinoinensis]
MERLVEVSEPEVRLDFALNCKCRANVRLRSLCATTPITFKVQTSSPNKFLVNPPCGLIPPLSYATFQIILKPQTQLPPTFPRSPSDRFLIKTAKFVSSSLESTRQDSINSWFSTIPYVSTQDLKLKVAFVGPILLLHAVRCGDLDAVRSLIKRQKSVLSELSPREAESLLRVASELVTSEEMVNLLVEAGLKIDTRVKLDNASYPADSSKGWCEVHVAVAFDRKDEMLSLIRMRGYGSLDSRDREGRSILHLAASKGSIKCAKVLLESGADANARSKDGRTALYRAAANGDRRMVGMLIESGADPTIPNDRGRSPLDVARDKGHKEVVEILERGEAVLMAAMRGELERLETLLRKGADISYRDQYGLTALHAAAMKGHRDATLILVEYGVDWDCQDNEGHTPLHLAVHSGSMETVEVLVDNGADVNAKSAKGTTSLYMAGALCYDDISQFLISRGAHSSDVTC